MKVLIAITTCAAHAERRQAQRDTWIKYLEGLAYADCRFFLGKRDLEVVHKDAQSSVFVRQGDVGTFDIAPADTHSALPSDEVYLSGVSDDLAGLSQKTKALMLWADEHAYDFVFKADDDTYIHIPRLLASGFEAHEYSGFVEGIGTSLMFAQGGAGYWVNAKAIRILGENMLDKKHAEDWAVGETLMEHGILPVHNARYQPQVTRREREFPSICPDAITWHKCTPFELRLVHERVAASKDSQLLEARQFSREEIASMFQGANFEQKTSLPAKGEKTQLKEKKQHGSNTHLVKNN